MQETIQPQPPNSRRHRRVGVSIVGKKWEARRPGCGILASGRAVIALLDSTAGAGRPPGSAPPRAARAQINRRKNARDQDKKSSMNTTSGFDRCFTFINSQLKPAGAAARLEEERGQRGVTVSRQSGCRGFLFAEELAFSLYPRTPGGSGAWLPRLWPGLW